MSPDRAQTLIQTLGLTQHPEGGWYRELFRSPGQLQPADGRGLRSLMTSIDFLLQPGERSAWHRVTSDEAWHLLEGGPLRLWLIPPTLDSLRCVTLAPVDAQGHCPRHVVSAGWWQAAEPEGDSAAYVGATVAPGFDFADFSFGRDDAALVAALPGLQADLARLL